MLFQVPIYEALGRYHHVCALVVGTLHFSTASLLFASLPFWLVTWPLGKEGRALYRNRNEGKLKLGNSNFGHSHCESCWQAEGPTRVSVFCCRPCHSSNADSVRPPCRAPWRKHRATWRRASSRCVQDG